MDIEKIIAPRKLSEVTQIYYGLENCCRCGCGGKYHEHGSRGFTRAINALKKLEPLAKGEEMHARDGRICKCEGVAKGSNYVDIPVDGTTDKCFCLYFD